MKDFVPVLNTFLYEDKKVYPMPLILDGVIQYETLNDINKKTFCKLCKSFKKPFITYCNNVLNMNIE